MAAQKLIYKLTVLAIIPAILSMILFGIISYTIYKEQLIKGRTEEAISLIDFSTEQIKNPLYFLELNKLNYIIESIKKNPNILSAYIMDPSGRVITDGTYENILYNQTLNDDFTRKSLTSKEIMAEIKGDVLQISSPIILDRTIGIMKVDLSIGEIYLVLKKIVATLIFIGLAIFIIVLVVDYSVIHSILKPVVSLRDAANEIAHGNFAARAIISSNDEIGEMASAFNKMAQDLHISNEERNLADERVKKSLKEKEVLLREIHHRVKNNMQIISSLLMLQSQYIKDDKYADVIKESQNRIISMSLVHEKLYQSRDLAKIDFKDYIRDMMSNLFQSYGSKAESIKLILDIDNLFRPVDSAIPCGLIINELVTNSLKYAFPDGRKGEIRIVLRKADGNMIELIVGDDGIGFPEGIDFRKTESLGLHLVTILAESQLQGNINLNRDRGTEFKICFEVRNNDGKTDIGS